MDNQNQGSDPLDRFDFGGFKETNEEQLREAREWHNQLNDDEDKEEE